VRHLVIVAVGVERLESDLHDARLAHAPIKGQAAKAVADLVRDVDAELHRVRRRCVRARGFVRNGIYHGPAIDRYGHFS
jgi:hypothetical protein